ncbi:MAG TPA: hypothetical protein VI704_08170 [Bacteroidota bacterium]|nr:hypothetical protein [Bacteroidota bacterium]
MKPLLLISLLVAALDVQPPPKVFDKHRVQRSFRRTTETPYKKIILDNIAGGIAVEGYEGDEIRLVVEQRYEAESEEKLKEAKQEITLEIEEKKDRLILCVDAPWRDKWGHRHDGWDYYGYDAQFEFELKVPRKMDLFLKTVNEGNIAVRNIEGDFDFRNVNGGIEVKDVAGSGRMHTVNGPVNAVFTKVPKEDCTFKTVNGKIELEFPDDLRADLRFKTFNGNVYTDFDVESLSRRIMPIETRRGRKVYHKDASFGVRIGSGGSLYAFETLNGNIYILKRTFK